MPTNEQIVIIKEYLGSYLWAKKEKKGYEDKLQEQTSKCERSTSTISEAPISSGIKTRENDYVDLLMLGGSTYLTEKINECEQKMKDIEALIDTLNKEQYRLVLKRKYIDGMTYLQIANKERYSLSTIEHYAVRAVKILAQNKCLQVFAVNK